MNENKSDPVVTLLAVIGMIAPLAGLLWGPGTWWAYLLWLAAGTLITVGYANTHSD